MDTDTIGVFTAVYLPQLPVLAVFLVGIGVALAFWQRHPTVSLLALIAFVTPFLTTLVGTHLSYWLPRTLIEQSRPVSHVAATLAAVSGVRSLLSAAAFALLVAAVFGWCSAQRRLEGGLR